MCLHLVRKQNEFRPRRREKGKRRIATPIFISENNPTNDIHHTSYLVVKQFIMQARKEASSDTQQFEARFSYQIEQENPLSSRLAVNFVLISYSRFFSKPNVRLRITPLYQAL